MKFRMDGRVNQTKKFKLEDVERLLTLRTWWAVWGVLPLANRLVLLFANHTHISPNMITFLALILRCLSGAFFFTGDYPLMILGSMCYYFAYVMDCTDGPVARLKKKSSEFGRLFDHVSDLTGDLYILFCLSTGQGRLFSIMVFAMAFLHIVESYTSYLSNMIIQQSQTKEKPGWINSYHLFQWYQSYRDFFLGKNLKTFVSFPDYEFFVFIVFPISGFAGLGLEIGFWILLSVVSYTLFSTFWCIHSGGQKFP